MYTNGKEYGMIYRGGEDMRTAAANKAQYKYNAKKYKRIPLDYPLTDFPKLQEAAKQAGQSVNGYIKQAISDRMEKESD